MEEKPPLGTSYVYQTKLTKVNQNSQRNQLLYPHPTGRAQQPSPAESTCSPPTLRGLAAQHGSPRIGIERRDAGPELELYLVSNRS